MPQTSYTINQTAGRAGLQYDIGFNDVYSLAAEVAIPFGCFVCVGTDPVLQCKLPAAATDITDMKKIRGLALDDGTHMLSADQLSVGYAATEAVSVMKRGRAWVVSEQDWLVTDAPFVRYANGVADATKTQKGSVRIDADTSTAAALPKAKFLNSGAAGGYALVEFDLVGA